MTKQVWTIGYERTGIPDFISALTTAKIKTLVDVREIANSRRAGFSKKALAANLSEAGIGYIHMQALGTPKAGREAARRGDTKVMARIFEAKMVEPDAQLALAETAALARRGRICLMCLEHDWRGCHRNIIAHHLEADFALTPKHLSPGPSAPA